MARTAAVALTVTLAIAGRAFGQTDEQVAARLTPTVHVCEKAPENGGTFEQALCYKDEALRQDQHLNTVWIRIIDRLSPERRESIRRSERHWITDRDKTCHDEADRYVNSTAAYMFNLCLTDQTIRRIIWLESAH